MRPLVALPVLGVVMFFSAWIAFRNGFMPGSGIELFITLLGIAVAYVAVFALDRVLWNRFKGIASTLVFPLAATAVSFLATFGNPLGTGGAEPYSQTNLPLLQLTAITGIWGVAFLISWFASVFNAWWEQGFSLRKTWKPIVLFAVVVSICIVAGALRLSFSTSETPTVRTALIAPNRDLNDQSLVEKISTDKEIEEAQKRIQPLMADLFARTEREARAGAKIIAWSEASGKLLKSDESTIFDRASRIANDNDIYLQLGVQTFANGDKNELLTENRAIMFTPDGEKAWDYHKTKITPGDTEKPGEGVLPSIDTPYGRIGTIICQDDLFPDLVAQAGRDNVDILLVPSSDWRAVAEWHARTSTTRAIENGVSIVRPTRKGVSLVNDPLGRTLAYKADYFTGSDQTLVASVPTKGTDTIYPHFVDWVGYASLLGTVAISLFAVLRRHPRV